MAKVVAPFFTKVPSRRADEDASACVTISLVFAIFSATCHAGPRVQHQQQSEWCVSTFQDFVACMILMPLPHDSRRDTLQARRQVHRSPLLKYYQGFPACRTIEGATLDSSRPHYQGSLRECRIAAATLTQPRMITALATFPAAFSSSDNKWHLCFDSAGSTRLLLGSFWGSYPCFRPVRWRSSGSRRNRDKAHFNSQSVDAPSDRWSTSLGDHRFITIGFSECIFVPSLRFNGIKVCDGFIIWTRKDSGRCSSYIPSWNISSSISSSLFSAIDQLSSSSATRGTGSVVSLQEREWPFHREVDALGKHCISRAS